MVCSILPSYLTYVVEMGEIWNYQYARRILYGQIPYRDFGMLQLPFSAQVNALFLYVFSDKLIVMRVVGGLIGVINGLVAYKILQSLGKKQLMCFAYTILFVSPFLVYSHNNYSWYAVLFLSIGLMFEIIDLTNGNAKSAVLVGALLGLATISKQNIGAFGLAATLLFLGYLTFSRNREITGRLFPVNKNEIVKFQAAVSLRLLGWTFIILSEAVYLWLNDGLSPLVRNMFAATFGLVSSASISYWDMLLKDDFTWKLIGLLIPILLIAPFLKALSNSTSLARKRQLVLLGLYAAVNFSMVFPIADAIHLVLGMPMAVIAMAACFGDSDYPSKTTFLPSNKTLIVLLFAVLLTVIITNIREFNSMPRREINHYEYIPMPGYRFNQMREVDEAILDFERNGKTIYFLNHQADYYLIPLDRFSYRYDVVNRGAPEVQEIIQLISGTENIAVIIRGTAMEASRVENQDVEHYVRDTMKYVKTVQDFDIFIR